MIIFKQVTVLIINTLLYLPYRKNNLDVIDGICSRCPLLKAL